MNPLPRLAAIAVTLTVTATALGGPEITLRDYAGSQVKKGVRTIGMGGDGATTGNYGLVYRDAGSAIFDEGLVRFTDTGNFFTFSGVGFTTPRFWDNAAFYVIALTQRASDAHVWSLTPPSASKPSARGNLANSSVFVKFAKPLSDSLSLGFMGAFEQSDALLLPDNGAPAIRFATEYRPSGGMGVHWHPDKHWQAGIRVILNNDWETREQASQRHSGLLRSYEYRAGMAYSPFPGTLLDVGGVALQRSNGLEHTKSFNVHPNLGAEQALVARRVWARAGLDETTWTTGMSVSVGRFKLDLAYLYNLAAARTGDIFGKRNASLISTLVFDYEGAAK